MSGFAAGIAAAVRAVMLTTAYNLGKSAGRELGEADGFNECVSETRKLNDEAANAAALGRQRRRACTDSGGVWDLTNGVCEHKP